MICDTMLVKNLVWCPRVYDKIDHTTDKIWRKSPLKTMAFPPNIVDDSLPSPMMSLRLLSNVSKKNLWAIGASSHIINFVTFKSSANSLPWWILQIESSKVGTWILNLECVVRPQQWIKQHYSVFYYHDTRAESIKW